MADENPGVALEDLVTRMRDGDAAARDELLNRSAARLLELTRRMIRDFRRVGRWEQTEDVCQNASLRLWRALQSTRPGTVADFQRLAAAQIRRELIDLARSYYGPEGVGAHHHSDAAGAEVSGSPPPAYEAPQTTHDPGRVAAWTEFHCLAERLPADEREVFDLLWYAGMSQAGAAAALGVSEPTIRRRWRAARLRLAQVLEGGPID